MLAIILKQSYADGAMPTNVHSFILECEKGTLYDTLVNAARNTM